MSKTLPLTVDAVHKDFDKVKAVRGVSFSIEPGQVLGIVGPNGAGKTTTIKMILGLIEPDKGSIRLFGESITSPTVRQRVGYMPETPSFYKHLTGRELITFAGSLFGMGKQELAKKSQDLLKLVGLQKAGDRAIGGYSKGMLQRICLAQALVNQPELLFLDEPLDGLDPIGRIHMREILQEVKETGTAIVFNSHILSDVEAVATHIAIMDQGELVKYGTTQSIVPAGKTLEEVFIAAVGSEREQA